MVDAAKWRFAMTLETQNLEVGYEQRIIVKNLNLRLQLGKISTIIGANGSGKSTILRAIARLLKPKAGAVLLDGKNIHTSPSKIVAQQLAILPQAPTAPEGITVEALVQFGRYPHQKFLQPYSSADYNLVESALEQTKMQEFKHRPLETLSGGQRQRAWIAMALAQNTPWLLLDEPTTYLDIMHQLEVLHLLEELNSKTGKTIVMVLHDLNQAARCSHELIAIKNGQVVSQDTPNKVLNHALLREVFGIKAHILPDPSTGKPHIIPYGLAVGT
jgi:iron complex transport system ATP-binding protein